MLALTEDSRTTDFGLGWFRLYLTEDSRTIEFWTQLLFTMNISKI